MTVGSLARLLAHRWYLTVLVVVAVALACRAAWGRAQPEYQTTATFLVTPSAALSVPQGDAPAGTQPGSRNPFTLAGGASTLAATLSTTLNTAPVQANLLGDFPDAGFTAAEAVSSTGNRTYFEVAASTARPEDGPAVVAAALQEATRQLADVQRRVQAPENGLFIVIQSTPTDGPRELYPDRARAVGTIALGGLAAGTVLVVLADLLLSALGSRRQRRAPGATGTPGTTGTAGAPAAPGAASPAGTAPAGTAPAGTAAARQEVPRAVPVAGEPERARSSARST